MSALSFTLYALNKNDVEGSDQNVKIAEEIFVHLEKNYTILCCINPFLLIYRPCIKSAKFNFNVQIEIMKGKK